MAFIELRTRGTKRVTAKFKTISVNMRSKLAPAVVAEGYKYARNIAPFRTGALYNAIQMQTRAQSGQVIVHQPHDGRNRPYHLWFHGIKAPSPTGKNGAGKGYDLRTGKYSPTSGVPNFMDYTYDYMVAEAPKEAERQIRKAMK